jgi:hypothetical protein
MTRYWKTIRILIATIAVALAIGLPAAPAARAAGLVNCVELSGRSGACQESVWANGVEFRMVFPQEAREFPGARPSAEVSKFYVLAPQTGTPQGALPFPHDHVVAYAPAQNQGNYSVLLRGFLVFCTEQGAISGACVPFTGAGLPLAETVNGQALTSAGAIEAAASAGLVMLVDTNATFLGIINPGK